MSSGVVCRCGLDPTLLWLWYRLAATALIQPLAWEIIYAVSAPNKSKKKKKKKKKKERKKERKKVCICSVKSEKASLRRQYRIEIERIGRNLVGKEING